MSRRKGENEVLEVEVERLPGPESDPPSGPDAPRTGPGALARAFGPIVAGILVDLLDAATMTPLLGLALGLPLGYYIARQLGLQGRRALPLAALIAAYCALPGTSVIPLGTLVGTYSRLRGVIGGGRG